MFGEKHCMPYTIRTLYVYIYIYIIFTIDVATTHGATTVHVGVHQTTTEQQLHSTDTICTYACRLHYTNR